MSVYHLPASRTPRILQFLDVDHTAGRLLALAGLLACGLASVAVAGELQHQFIRTVIGLLAGI